ncbi:MAG: hypothetical protein NT069_28500 [Planctomycetota bacterium]|nr:hypothetical protein [Planctomycetota bacterium]
MKTRRSLRNPTWMLLTLTVLTTGTGISWGQSDAGTAPRGQSQPDSGQRLLAQADERPAAPVATKIRTAAAELKRSRELLTKHSTIRARIIEQVTLAERSYRAEGRYLQLALKPGDWQMRMELVLKVGDSEGSLLEVCSGTVLLDAARRSGDFSEQTETDLLTGMGLGGLPALLASLEQNMKLGTVKEETYRDRPVNVISGTWSESVAARMTRPGPGGGPGLLPPTVPDQMRLYLDKETGFPYRLLYLKKVPNRDVLKPMLTLDFRDVVLNEPIPSSEFDYKPPTDVQPVELTNFYIEQFAPQGTKDKK